MTILSNISSGSKKGQNASNPNQQAQSTNTNPTTSDLTLVSATGTLNSTPLGESTSTNSPNNALNSPNSLNTSSPEAGGSSFSLSGSQSPSSSSGGSGSSSGGSSLSSSPVGSESSLTGGGGTAKRVLVLVSAGPGVGGDVGSQQPVGSIEPGVGGGGTAAELIACTSSQSGLNQELVETTIAMEQPIIKKQQSKPKLKRKAKASYQRYSEDLLNSEACAGNVVDVNSLDNPQQLYQMHHQYHAQQQQHQQQTQWPGQSKPAKKMNKSSKSNPNRLKSNSANKNATNKNLFDYKENYYHGNDNNNSEDEYETAAFANKQTNLANQEEAFTNYEKIEENFCRALKEKKGYIIKSMKEDGACLFRAVADQIYGDEEMHSTVRCHCMDYIAKNADYFKQYITEDVDRYITRKRQDTCFGNHIEIIAIAEIYNRPIEVYEYGTEPKNTFQSVYQTDNEPIRLSYHGRNHYNSVVDPYKATIGVGLGLPQFIPGLAEKNLMSDAIKKSEEFQLEQAMLDDKLKATDWEATNEEIMELVAHESYLQWLKDNEKRSNEPLEAAATCSSWDSSARSGSMTPKQQSPKKQWSPKPKKEQPTTTTADINSADDSDILARVLAASQQEYLDSLKAKRHQNNFR